MREICFYMTTDMYTTISNQSLFVELMLSFAEALAVTKLTIAQT